jgi:hypothetical protein
MVASPVLLLLRLHPTRTYQRLVHPSKASAEQNWDNRAFFKECKSELGMCQYKLATGPFQRVLGWVDLSVTAFCYLEWYRHQRQQQASGKDRPFWQRLRCAGLKDKVRQHALRADIESLLRLATTDDAAHHLTALLDSISAQESSTAA